MLEFFNLKHTIMIENLLSTLKSEVGSQILSQTKLPANNLDKVFSVIGDVTKKEVTGQMLGGNLSNVMNLFSKQANNPGANQSPVKHIIRCDCKPYKQTRSLT